MKTLHRLLFILIIAAFLFGLPSAVLAQSPEYRLDVSRDFGYGAGSNVRGSFSNHIVGPADNIVSVTFLIDDQVMAEVSEPPFVFKYHTDNYPSGWHEMTARIVTKDGREVTTPPVSVNLLTAAGQNQGMQRIFVPLAVILVGVTAIGLAVQFFMMRRSGPTAPGAPRKYGFKGGTICPRCGRAYAIHFFSVNLIGGVLDRCDHCGKVAFVRARSRADLDAAVAAETSAAQSSEHSLPGLQGELSDEERAKKLLDDSRFME